MARAIAVAIVASAAATTFGSVLVLSGTASAAPTCTINFNNSAGGSFFTASDWNDASNSSVHRVPDSTDYACIPSSVTGAVTFSTGTSATIDGISAAGSGGFSAGSGTLTLSDASDSSSIKNLDFSGGTIDGAGNLSVSGAVAWSGGTMSGTGTVTVASSATVTDTGGTLEQPLTNDGTIDVTSGGLSFDDSAVLTNASSGVINLEGDGVSLGTGYGASGSVSNSGLILVTSTSGTDYIEVGLTTSLSKLTFASGTETLLLNAGGSLSGTASIPTGVTMAFDDGTWALDGASFTGAGTTSVYGGYGVTWQLTGSNVVSSLFDFSGGTIDGAGNLSLSGAVAWSGGTMSGTGTVTVASSATVTDTGGTLEQPLTNDGTIDVTSGGLSFDDSAVLTNASSGVINLEGDGVSLGTGYGASGSVSNSGLILVSSTSGTDYIEVGLTNDPSGIVEITAGQLDVSTLTNEGQVSVGLQSLDVTGAFTSSSKGVLEITLASTGTGTVDVGGSAALGGELALTTGSGYTPAIGTTDTLLTTTGKQTGKFKSIAGQTIGSTETGWRVTSKAPKVVVSVKNLSDVAASMTAPSSATIGSPFAIELTVTNNGPKSSTGTALTLDLPTAVTVSGALPSGCTQPTTTTVKCSAGTLADGKSTTFTINVQAAEQGTSTFSVTASTTGTDIVPANNTAKESVTIDLP